MLFSMNRQVTVDQAVPWAILVTLRHSFHHLYWWDHGVKHYESVPVLQVTPADLEPRCHLSQSDNHAA